MGGDREIMECFGSLEFDDQDLARINTFRKASNAYSRMLAKTVKK